MALPYRNRSSRLPTLSFSDGPTYEKMMRRREFLALVPVVTAVWAGNTRAQAQSNRVIGFFSSGSPYEWAPFVAAFREGLAQAGYGEGRNVAIEFRWGFGERDRLPALARELAARPVDVFVSSGGFTTVRTALEASSTIPVVAVFGGDPVTQNLLATIARPGGRITGVSLVSTEAEVKRLQIVREFVPGMGKVGFITDHTIPPDREMRKYFDNATRRLGLEPIVISASTDAEIDDAFPKLVQARVDAVEVASTAYFLDRRDRFAALAARYRLAAMYPARAYVDAGGLVSYGVDRLETYRQLGRYTGTVLNGGVPADMPVLQPSKFELTINAKTAKALGITIPQSLLTLADAVIQ